MARWSRLSERNPALPLALLTHVVFLVVLAVWRLGWLQNAELYVYDLAVQYRASRPQAEPPVVLVGANETDLDDRGWPQSDQVLSDLLEGIEDGRPRAIGLDIYRKLPRPPGDAAFNQTLLQHDNIIVIYKFADEDWSGIAAPGVLHETDRIGFADILMDPGGIVRRGLLFLDDGKGNFGTSLALLLAQRYLAQDGICLQSDGTPANNMAFGSCQQESAAPSSIPKRPLTIIPPLDKDDGGYVDADSRGYQFPVDYAAGSKPIKTVTFGDVLDHKIDRSVFKDKIVVVGTTAESVKDFFFTPFSNGPNPRQSMYGIEIHGHAASQLVRYGLGQQRPVMMPPTYVKVICIWVWCVAGAALGYLERTAAKYSLFLVLGTIVLGIYSLALFMSGIWLPVAPQFMGWLTTAIIATSLMSQIEKAQRALLMQMFSRHVSPDVAQELWNKRELFMDGGRPRPQRLTATVLFADLVGFTPVSEGMEPAALMDWLNRIMDAMTNVVTGHGGVVDKFLGDALMVLFGVPRTSEHDMRIGENANAAVRCALAMAAALDKLNDIFQSEGRPSIGMRIGIYTGDLVAGGLGSSDRMDYTVIGDTVNTASRLESFDKTLVDADRPHARCRILVGSSTQKYLSTDIRTERVGAVSLKGKADTIEVYIVKTGGL